MDVLESNIHSFIVKVWLEELKEENGRAVWRGRVTHVPSNKRWYIQSLDELEAIIMPYLMEMGVKPRLKQRLILWLRSRLPRRGIAL